MAKKHDRDGRKDRYFVLYHYMLNTEAWKALTPAARAVYIQIGARYDGFNNGKIAFSVRDAASEVGINKNTASRTFKELIDGGFIEETRHGGLSRKTRVASEWRLTAFKCDLTGALKSSLFMQRWAWARDQHLSRSRPQDNRRLSQTRAEPVPIDARECLKRGYSLSQSTLDQPSECLKRGYSLGDFGPSPVPNEGTHIIYQVGVSSVGPSEGGLTSPDVPPPSRPATAAEPSANPADLTFPMIDGVYRIASRSEPVVVLAEPRPTLPLAKPSDVAVHEGLAR